ncbi:hypothetical protein C8R47DRAFT_1083615 [Mycena vitilis]|nr:hypothetical protein C8R47DRAFT_1083615 [Mycena vitilis]
MSTIQSCLSFFLPLCVVAGSEGGKMRTHDPASASRIEDHIDEVLRGQTREEGLTKQCVGTVMYNLLVVLLSWVFLTELVSLDIFGTHREIDKHSGLLGGILLLLVRPSSFGCLACTRVTPRSFKCLVIVLGKHLKWAGTSFDKTRATTSLDALSVPRALPPLANAKHQDGAALDWVTPLREPADRSSAIDHTRGQRLSLTADLRSSPHRLVEDLYRDVVPYPLPVVPPNSTFAASASGRCSANRLAWRRVCRRGGK